MKICRRSFLQVIRDCVPKEKKFRQFTSDELDFIVEYEKIMKPVANKLDILQGDKNSHLGCLLPHITHLHDTLTQLLRGMKGPLAYCKPIVKVMLTSLRLPERFGHVFENPDYRLASVFHPAYKFGWITMWDPSQLEPIRELMIKTLAEELRARDPEAHASQPVTAERTLMPTVMDVQADIDSEDEDHLTNLCNAYAQRDRGAQQEASEKKKTYSELATELIKIWESIPAKRDLEDAAFMDNSIFKDMFVRTNTGVVSSAACERFFSQGKDTLRAKRESMSPHNFESLMFLRGNSHLWAVPSARKRRESANKLKHPQLEALSSLS